MLQHHLIKPGTLIRVKPLATLPTIGTIEIVKVEYGAVHTIYKPDEHGPKSGYQVTYPMADCEWMISRGLWVEAPTVPTLPAMDEDAQEELMTGGGMKALEQALKAMNSIWAIQYDEASVLSLIESRVREVWDRANAHRAQDEMKNIDKDSRVSRKDEDR